MPKNTFALEPGGPKRIEISWSGFWKNIKVSFDGAEVGSIADKSALTDGRDIKLPDGSMLHVELKKGLVVTRNGEPLPGSSSDLETLVKTAAYIMYFVAGLNLCLGFGAEIFHVRFLTDAGLGWAAAAVGVLFAVF